MKILLDTNMLITAVRFKADIFAQLRGHELVVLNNCINELEKLSRKRGEAGSSAKIALLLLKARGVKIARSKERNADKAISYYALKNDCAVATNDRALIKALKNNGIKVIRLRQRKKIIGVTE